MTGLFLPRPLHHSSQVQQKALQTSPVVMLGETLMKQASTYSKTLMQGCLLPEVEGTSFCELWLFSF